MIKKFFSIIIVMFAFIIAFATNANAASSNTPRWEKSPIKVYIPDDTNSGIVHNAFNTWQNQSYGKLKFTYVKKGPADIDIVYIDKINTSDSPIASYVTKTKGSAITKAEIKIATKNPAFKKYSKRYVYITMLHEIGHTLGLSDDHRKKSGIMYMPISENQRLRRDDMIKLYNLYDWNWMQRRF